MLEPRADMPFTFNVHKNLDDIFEDMNSVDVVDLYAATSLLSDDIWKKFELDAAPLYDCDDDIVVKFESFGACSSWFTRQCEIRNHDCMWAGHCGSKEHPADEPRPQLSRPVVVAPVAAKTHVQKQLPAASGGRSLLLRTVVKSPTTLQTPVVPTPESPPMSDDEEVKVKTTLQMLHDAISECDLDDDSDLCEYFEEDEEEEEEEEEEDEEEEDEQEQEQEVVAEPEVKATHPRAQFARDNDHSYHKDKNASMRVTNLGIETPSDSEEEIDVVSVGEKQNTSRMVCTLPNNPSSLDKQQLQKTMATAISNKSMSTGRIKTILPFRKPPSVEHSPVKRSPENRGTKRSRYPQHRSSSPGSPYKRRGGSCTNHSSDSEAEPSEKRNLHNNMERQRRIDLRNAFEDLRLLVPEVTKKDRAAKVVILREAAVYCDQLGDASEDMTRQVDELRKQQERLRARVSQLRRSLAAKHR